MLVRTVAHELLRNWFLLCVVDGPGRKTVEGQDEPGPLSSTRFSDLCLFDCQACALPLFQSALVSANVSVSELRQFLRGHTAQRTSRAAAVYDDLRILG